MFDVVRGARSEADLRARDVFRMRGRPARLSRVLVPGPIVAGTTGLPVRAQGRGAGAEG
jgi:hypothetical protein